jgi:hypothetical protein
MAHRVHIRMPPMATWRAVWLRVSPSPMMSSASLCSVWASSRATACAWSPVSRAAAGLLADLAALVTVS